MGSSVEEDFADVAEFVKEDYSYVDNNTSEDELERKIAEEHLKYKEAQAKRQEEVRANRPWSAPPVESPRPEHQKEREMERKARASVSDAAPLDGPRSEYEPPARPYLLQAQASGGSNLSYMSRPQSGEHRAGRISSNGNRGTTVPQSPASLSGIEEEAGETATSGNSRRASDVGPQSGGNGGAPDNVPGRDQYGTVAEEGEGDGDGGEEPGDDAAGDGATAAAANEEEDRPAAAAEAPMATVESLAVALAVAEEPLAAAAEQGEEPAPGDLGDAGAAAADGTAAAEESSVPAEAAEESETLRSAPPSGDTDGGEAAAAGMQYGQFEGYGQSDAVDGDADGLGGRDEAADDDGTKSVNEHGGQQDSAGNGDLSSDPAWASGMGQGSGADGSEPALGGGLAAGELSSSLRGPPLDDSEAGGGEGGATEEGAGGEQGRESEDAHVTDAEWAAAEAEGADRLHDEGGGAESDAERAGEEAEQERTEGGEQGDDGWGAADAGYNAYQPMYAAPQPEPSSTGDIGPQSMAMRGFVEPLPYESSYGAASESRRPPFDAGELQRHGSGKAEAAESATEGGGEQAEHAPAQEWAEERGDEGQQASGEGSSKADKEEHRDENGEDEYDDDDYDDSFESDVPESDDKTRSIDIGGSSRAGGINDAASSRRQSAPSAEASAPALPSREPSAPPQPSREPSAPPPLSQEPSAPLPQPSREPSGLPPLSREPSMPPPALSAELSHHSRSSAGGAPPLLPPLTSSNSATALPPLRSRPAASSTTITTPEDEDDEQVYKRAAAAAAGSSHRASGTGSLTTTSGLDLLPPQQFALQLLKHDIDVLPQHHKAAAEAAAARRKPSSARPAGAGLAAFGYLGYHLVTEDLTAPSGPIFRSVSPGRSGSPGRASGGSGAALTTSPSLNARNSDGGAAGRGGGVGVRPSSTPHMRPDGSSPDSPDGAASGAAGDKGAPAGAAREARGGLLPPVRGSSGGSGAGGTPPVPERSSLSVLEEDEAHAAHTRMKFDVWLDALSGAGGGGASAKADPDAGGVKHPAGSLAIPDGGDAAARRQPRPMTAPAYGVRRPMSARVGAAGLYGVAAPPAAAPKPLGGRPMSAQPHHLRPASASRRGGNEQSLVDVPVPVTVTPTDSNAHGAGGTAAVDVAGATVSVYVADTLKRIVEANRWLQQMGVTTKRYRLKDRFSSMTVQLCEELPPLASEQLQPPAPYDGGAVAVIKELTLKQFLSGHAKLRQQVKKIKAAVPVVPLAHNAGQAAVPPLPASASHGPAAGGAAGGRTRPFSAGPAGPAPGSPALGGGRVRPASAMPHSGGGYGGAASAGGAGPAPYAGAPGATVASAGRPVRPNSANPAYGRTPLFNAYSGGSSPPGGTAGPYTGLASYGGGATTAAGGKLPPPRAAWGATGGSGNDAPAPRGGGGGGGANGHPHVYHRSMSAAARTSAGILEDDDETEGRPLVLDVDEKGDISRAVRQQLGGATDYCQTKRNEIARLRIMPLL